MAAIDVAEETKGAASLIRAKAEKMTKALTRGINSLPEGMEEDCADGEKDKDVDEIKNRGRSNGADSGDGRDRSNEEICNLLDVDTDIAELENSCNASRGGLNIFSAPTIGTAVFESTASKGERCQQLFQHMKTLFGTVGELAQSIIHGNCCVQMRSIVTGAKHMFSCRHLANLLSTAAEAVVQAISDLIQTAWQRFEGFTQELGAAKKIRTFVSGFKKTTAGIAASGYGCDFVNLLPGSRKPAGSRTIFGSTSHSPSDIDARK